MFLLFDYPLHPCYNYSNKKTHGGKCMHYYEYGKENDKTIVFLHGANFVHSFGRQYPLAENIILLFRTSWATEMPQMRFSIPKQR